MSPAEKQRRYRERKKARAADQAPPDQQQCANCATAKARLQLAVDKGNALRQRLANYTAYGDQLKQANARAASRIAELEARIAELEG